MKKNEKNKIKNRFFIHSVKSLVPTNSLNKNYYIIISINDLPPLKSKTFEFKKNTQVDILQTLDLGDFYNIKTISFQIFEINGSFSTALFKGDASSDNLAKDTLNNTFMCFLSNSNMEVAAVINYNYEINTDLIDTFDNNLSNLLNESKKEERSTYSNLKDLAIGGNAENFTKFVKNMSYLKTVQNSFDEFINWRNTWKTFSILMSITMGTIYDGIFFIILPILILYFHVYNRKNMNYFSHKNTKHDNIENMTVITNIIKLTNCIFDYYEMFIDGLEYSEKSFLEEIWADLLKLVLWNIIIIQFNMIKIKVILLSVLWVSLLWKNPPFHAFAKFLLKFINKKFIAYLTQHPRYNNIRGLSIKIFFMIVPFSNLCLKLFNINNERKSLIENIPKTLIVETTVNSSPGEISKFEIYENERWWMFVGWAKNLILNERPLWSDISGKNYLDKNSVFLPNNDEYQWISDWRIEANENTDNNGWEYASDFNSKFGSNSVGKYVRKRKWVRHAKKIK